MTLSTQKTVWNISKRAPKMHAQHPSPYHNTQTTVSLSGFLAAPLRPAWLGVNPVAPARSGSLQLYLLFIAAEQTASSDFFCSQKRKKVMSAYCVCPHQYPPPDPPPLPLPLCKSHPTRKYEKEGAGWESCPWRDWRGSQMLWLKGALKKKKNHGILGTKMGFRVTLETQFRLGVIKRLPISPFCSCVYFSRSFLCSFHHPLLFNCFRLK